MKDFTNLAKRIQKALNLSVDEYESLLHDLNNLRGHEWYDTIKETKDPQLLEDFKKNVYTQADEKMGKEIKRYLKEDLDGHFDYNARIEALVEDFGIDPDTAEGYVWDDAAGLG